MEKLPPASPAARVRSKQIVINRTPKQNFVPGNRVSFSAPFGQSSGVGLAPEVAGSLAHKGVDDMKLKREGEKKELQDLNDRLANYLFQTRCLESENNALREEQKKRKEFDLGPIKEIYQTEIDETKKVLEEANKENAELKVNVSSLEDELEDQRSICKIHDERIKQLEAKVKALNEENSNPIAETDKLRRNTEELKKQVDHWKAKYDEVYKHLQVTRNDLKDETIERIAEYSRAEQLQEEIDFVKTITQAEIQEYKELCANRDDIDIRRTWDDELGQHMKELREEYEEKLRNMTDDLAFKYDVQLHRIREGMAKENQAKGLTKDKSARKADPPSTNILTNGSPVKTDSSATTGQTTDKGPVIANPASANVQVNDKSPVITNPASANVQVNDKSPVITNPASANVKVNDKSPVITIPSSANVQVNDKSPVKANPSSVNVPKNDESPTKVDPSSVNVPKNDESPTKVDPSSVNVLKNDESPTKVDPSSVDMPKNDESPTKVDPSWVNEPKNDESPTKVDPSSVDVPKNDESPTKVDPSSVNEPKNDESPTKVDPSSVDVPKNDESPTKVDPSSVNEPAKEKNAFKANFLKLFS